MITLTALAAEKIRALRMQANKGTCGVKIDIRPGGCHGFSYDIDFQKEAGEDDMAFESHGISVFIPRGAHSKLDGTTIDYAEDLKRMGFIIKNPNVKSQCHCGNSVEFA
ncbi:MAG: iron-sulfur cluster assembly accessory protein [Parcubacteria group bacterium]|nr:iron-sulfur cluster assembly accessory protein [Parcubacteria group bacterium]